MYEGSKKAVIMLTILLLVFTGSQAMLFGQSTPPITYTYTASVSNQATTNNCSAGEPVNLTGTVQFSYQVATDPATGKNQFSITASNNLAGVGQTTIGNYTASDSADYVLSSGQPSTEATVQLKSDLVSQGSGPSMSLVQTVDLTLDTAGNISAQVTDNSTQCGN